MLADQDRIDKAKLLRLPTDRTDYALAVQFADQLVDLRAGVRRGRMSIGSQLFREEGDHLLERDYVPGFPVRGRIPPGSPAAG